MIINDLDGYYIVFDTKNWNTELDTLLIWCKETIITMQESNYIDCVTFVMWLYDTYHTVGWQMPYNYMT